MKIISIVGARPQFVKAAAMSKEFKKHNNIKEIIIHTGQHYDKNMSEIFFEQLKIPKPKYNLKVNGGTHSEQTGTMMIKLEKILIEEKPDYVLVYGDTNSTLAGSITASKLHIPVIHVEAGFRSHDKRMPEEINRIITDHVSKILLCPTKQTMEELKKEGITKGVYFVGDIMYDSILLFLKLANEKDILEKFNVKKETYLYCTIHRAGNTDNENKLENIFNGLIESKEIILLPIHPRTKARLKEFKLWDKYQKKNIQFLEPINYLESLTLTKNAKKIITDSGGVLREAYFLKKTCIVLRNSIEFVEIIKNKEGVMVGSDKDKIVNTIKLFKSKGEYQTVFGNGDTAKKIVEIINNEFN